MNVNHYETTLILHPSLPKATVKSTLDKYTKALKQAKAKITHETHEGLQNLAYPIQKHTTGMYYTVQYEAPTDAVDKLEQAYRIDENILRFLSIRLDKHALDYHTQKRAEASKQDAQPTEGAPSDEDPNAAAEGAVQAPAQPRQKKYCRFTKFGIKYIDYKETNFLLRFLNPQGKILPRRLTGNSAKSQRMVKQAIKRSRHLGRLPYVTDNLK